MFDRKRLNQKGAHDSDIGKKNFCQMKEIRCMLSSAFFIGVSHHIDYREFLYAFSQESHHNQMIGVTKTALN